MLNDYRIVICTAHSTNRPKTVLIKFDHFASSSFHFVPYSLIFVAALTLFLLRLRLSLSLSFSHTLLRRLALGLAHSRHQMLDRTPIFLNDVFA